MLILSIVIMFLFFYKFYELDLLLTFIYLGFHIVYFLIFPIYTIQTTYLQLEYSTLKTNCNNLLGRILRFFLSFLKTPFCTVIAQVCSSIYQLVTMAILFYKVSKKNNQ